MDFDARLRVATEKLRVQLHQLAWALLMSDVLSISSQSHRWIGQHQEKVKPSRIPSDSGVAVSDRSGPSEDVALIHTLAWINQDDIAAFQTSKNSIARDIADMVPWCEKCLAWISWALLMSEVLSLWNQYRRCMRRRFVKFLSHFWITSGLSGVLISTQHCAIPSYWYKTNEVT